MDLPYLDTLIALFVAGAALWLLGRWAAAYSRALAFAAEQSDAFYVAAQRLIGDKRTPDRVVDFVEFLAARVGKPRLVRRLLIDMLRGKLRQPPETADSRAFGRDLDALPPELRRSFAEAIAATIMSSAASDPLFSKAYVNVLNLILFEGGKDHRPSVDRANTVALDLNSRAAAACAA